MKKFNLEWRQTIENTRKQAILCEKGSIINYDYTSIIDGVEVKVPIQELYKISNNIEDELIKEDNWIPVLITLPRDEGQPTDNMMLKYFPTANKKFPTNYFKLGAIIKYPAQQKGVINIYDEIINLGDEEAVTKTKINWNLEKCRKHTTIELPWNNSVEDTRAQLPDTYATKNINIQYNKDNNPNIVVKEKFLGTNPSDKTNNSMWKVISGPSDMIYYGNGAIFASTILANEMFPLDARCAVTNLKALHNFNDTFKAGDGSPIWYDGMVVTCLEDYTIYVLKYIGSEDKSYTTLRDPINFEFVPIRGGGSGGDGAYWLDYVTNAANNNVTFYKTNEKDKLNTSNTNINDDSIVVTNESLIRALGVGETDNAYRTYLEDALLYKTLDIKESDKDFNARIVKDKSNLGSTYINRSNRVGTTLASYLVLDQDIKCSNLDETDPNEKIGSGYYSNGMIIKRGTSVFEILKNILSKESWPDIVSTLGTVSVRFEKPTINIDGESRSSFITYVGKPFKLSTLCGNLNITTTNSTIKTFKEGDYSGFWYETTETDPSTLQPTKVWKYQDLKEIVIGDSDKTNDPDDMKSEKINTEWNILRFGATTDDKKYTIQLTLPKLILYNGESTTPTQNAKADTASTCEIAADDYVVSADGKFTIISKTKSETYSCKLVAINNIYYGISSEGNSKNPKCVSSPLSAVNVQETYKENENSVIIKTVLPIYCNGTYEGTSVFANESNGWDINSKNGAEAVVTKKLIDYTAGTQKLYFSTGTKGTRTNYFEIIIPEGYKVEDIKQQHSGTKDKYPIPVPFQNPIKESRVIYVDKNLKEYPFNFKKYIVLNSEYLGGTSAFLVTISEGDEPTYNKNI